MRSPLHYILSFLFITLLPVTQVLGQEVHTYVDRDSVLVGDVIHYTIVLNKDRNYRSVSFPDRDHFNDDLVFISRERHRTSANRDSVAYRLQSFHVDDFQIPRFDITLIDQESDTTILSTTPVPLYFKTVLTEEDPSFRPLKPIFDFTAAWWPWILGLILLAALIWYLYTRYQQYEPKTEPEPKPKPEPFINPFDTLSHSLQELGGEGSPLESRNFEKFYIRLGDSIRQYFEDVYEIDALEMTSREILYSLREYPADKEIIEITRKVLNEADMVKFAKFEPSLDQAQKALQFGKEFLKTVREIDKYKIEHLRQLHEEQFMVPEQKNSISEAV